MFFEITLFGHIVQMLFFVKDQFQPSILFLILIQVQLTAGSALFHPCIFLGSLGCGGFVWASSTTGVY